MSRDGREGQVLLEDRAGERVDVLSDERPEKAERGLRIAAQAQPPGRRDRPEIVRRSRREPRRGRELDVGRREIAALHRRERERDAGEKAETVGRESREERLDLRAQDRRRYVVRVTPGLADGVEGGGRLRRGREARDRPGARLMACAGYDGAGDQGPGDRAPQH